jgi:hypothetical protein
MIVSIYAENLTSSMVMMFSRIFLGVLTSMYGVPSAPRGLMTSLVPCPVLGRETPRERKPTHRRVGWAYFTVSLPSSGLSLMDSTVPVAPRAE